MRRLFGMRRADGCWFTLEVDGRLRVVVFRSLTGAWRVRAKNPEMALFWPALLTGSALEELSTPDGGRLVGFWLVDEEDPSCDLRKGLPLERAALTTLEGERERPRRGTPFFSLMREKRRRCLAVALAGFHQRRRRLSRWIFTARPRGRVEKS